MPFYASDLLSIGAHSEEKFLGIVIFLTMSINLAVFIVSFELQDVAVTADLFGHSAGRLHKVGKAAFVEYILVNV